MSVLTEQEMLNAKQSILTEMAKHFPNMAINPHQPLPRTSLSIEVDSSIGMTVSGSVSNQAGRNYRVISDIWSLREVPGSMVFNRLWATVDRLNVDDITQELLTLFYCQKLVVYMLDRAAAGLPWPDQDIKLCVIYGSRAVRKASQKRSSTSIHPY